MLTCPTARNRFALQGLVRHGKSVYSLWTHDRQAVRIVRIEKLSGEFVASVQDERIHGRPS